ncbi:MAG: CPBP family intramembrane metalloprotease [Chloroflexi bacterium]|nr:CPBP family intramembrane metalloprotease [Chloroflexota bacterium]
MQSKPETMWRAWTLLAIPPFLFLIAIIAMSVYFGAMLGNDPQAIADSVADSTPQILLIVQLSLLLVFWIVMRADRLTLPAIGWQLASGQKLWQEIVTGAVPGLILAVLYFSVLSPLMTTAQRLIGDYIPPGELLSSLGTSALPFFLANVALAPFVEENIYRGYGLTHLQKRFGVPAAILISCFFFGLLHWAGGFWYMLLTGIVAGGLLAGLFAWRKNIIAAFAAHFTLNLVEFLYVWLVISN